ncbi:hypothetical protein ACLOAU_06070 [Niabella sp. CJ426]|jgi:uncharacterized membrane protein|uniref:hypothetical protein n=1 Tax=Niabella sp. CJ426 TaxID=3393740 RepID=UPI003D0579F8
MLQSENEGASDLFNDGHKPSKKLSTKRNIIVLLLVCTGAGIVLYWIVSKWGGTRDIFGKILNEDEFRQNLIIGIAFSYPVIAFIIGLLISLLPYKKAAYKDKYIPFSLVALFVLYLSVIIWLLASLLMS